MSTFRIAIIYDRVNTAFGGAEQVLLALNQAYPQADLFTSVYNKKIAKWAKVYSKVIPSFLQKFPLAKKNHRIFVPLMPLAFESLDLAGYHIIISVTSAEAKGVITNPNQIHICYLLTPTRYLYSHKRRYIKSKKILQTWPIKQLANKTQCYLKSWDQVAIYRPDYIIPISNLVKKRVIKYYHLQSLNTIYPPVELASSEKQLSNEKKLVIQQLPSKYYLVISRLVSYKRLDLAIKACKKLKKHLVIIGAGPQLTKLKKLVLNYHNSQILFLGSQPDAFIKKLYNKAIALLMPGLEDFGITALEANAHGIPVILHQNSGAAEIIKHKKHGIHIETESVESLTQAILLREKIEFDQILLKKNLTKYDTNSFVANFKQQVNNIIKEWQHAL